MSCPMRDLELSRRRVGEILDGRYELRALLGVGMSGAVYEAFQRYTHRSVAVKVLHQQLLHDPEAVARFLREARALNAVAHPAIVEVIDAGETREEWPYVVLELLRGRSLGEAVAGGPIACEDLVAIGIDLLEGLSAAHAAGFVHRDVKPDNVFLLESVPLEPDGPRVKILDFGVAKNLQNSGASGVLTKPGDTIGTPSFMSPEQAKAQPVDARTDVWSAGASLFYGATGRPPFDERSVPALLLKLVTQQPPSLASLRPDAPAHLVRAVDGALQPDLERRWQSASIMASVLRGES